APGAEGAMHARDRVCVVTGGASGLGRAPAERFASDGARAVVVVDRDADGARAVAESVGGLGMPADVAREEDIRRGIDDTETRCGPIDLFCSNAGILVVGGPEVPTRDWQRIWEVNLMAHVRAAGEPVPRRGGGG